MNTAEGATDHLAWLAAQEPAMLTLLAEITAIDSGSYNKPGVDAVGAVIRRFLRSHGIIIAVLPQQKDGDCLRALVPVASRAGKAARNVLLLGPS